MNIQQLKCKFNFGKFNYYLRIYYPPTWELGFGHQSRAARLDKCVAES